MEQFDETRATLLGIPQELRDKILTLLVPQVEREPKLQGDTEARDYLDDTPCIRKERVKYLKSIHLPGGIPTLQVSRRLRAQTFAIMQHLKLPGPRSYLLDVMLIDGQELWPTWLYVPNFTTRVEKLVATLRDLGPSSRRYGRGFQNGDGGPPWMTWCFQSLLIRFLEAGALGPQEIRVDRRISVQVVELDVRTPDLPPERIASVEDSTPGRLRKRSRETGLEMVMNPMFILAFVRRWVNFIAGTRAFGGEMIQTRVGVLRLMLDGVIIEEYDVAVWLAKMPNTAWKLEAYAMREKFGLKTVLSKERIS